MIPNDPIIRIEHQYDVSPARLFEAIADPAQLAVWAWGSLGHMPVAEVDFRIGGALRVATTRPDGAVWSFFGAYTEIEPERRIVHTLGWDAPVGYEPAPEHLAFELTPTDAGTTLALIHTGLPNSSAEDHREGWKNVLDTLEQWLRGAN